MNIQNSTITNQTPRTHCNLEAVLPTTICCTAEIHTHTHTHTHTQRHTETHRDADTQTHSHIHTHTHTHTQTHTHTHTHTHSHTRTHARTHAHRGTQRRRHTHTHTQRHRHRQIRHTGSITHSKPLSNLPQCHWLVNSSLALLTHTYTCFSTFFCVSVFFPLYWLLLFLYRADGIFHQIVLILTFTEMLMFFIFSLNYIFNYKQYFHLLYHLLCFTYFIL